MDQIDVDEGRIKVRNQFGVVHEALLAEVDRLGSGVEVEGDMESAVGRSDEEGRVELIEVGGVGDEHQTLQLLAEAKETEKVVPSDPGLVDAGEHEGFEDGEIDLLHP